MEQKTIKQRIETPYAVKTNLSTFKKLDENKRTITAIANTYNFFDSDFDVLRKGCSAKSIRERGSKSNAPDKILHALFHDLTKLPGKSIHEEETDVEGNQVLLCESVLTETPLGEDTLTNYKKEIYNQHSIGFQFVQLEFVEENTLAWDQFLSTIINPEDAEKIGFGFNVTEINLFEWSTVAFGANKLTPFLGTKTQNKNIHYQNICTKMDVLYKAANRQDIKNKKLFNLQLNQLKQMILELAETKPSLKDTLPLEPSVKDTGIDYNSLILQL